MGSQELVILDEPTTGLDPESRREVWRLVSGLRDDRATVLITTHYALVAEDERHPPSRMEKASSSSAWT